MWGQIKTTYYMYWLIPIMFLNNTKNYYVNLFIVRLYFINFEYCTDVHIVKNGYLSILSYHSFISFEKIIKIKI